MGTVYQIYEEFNLIMQIEVMGAFIYIASLGNNKLSQEHLEFLMESFKYFPRIVEALVEKCV